MRPHLLHLVVVPLIAILLTGCSSSPLGTSPSPAVAPPSAEAAPNQTSSPNPSEAKLSPTCRWALSASVLKATRISAAAPVATWIQKYTGENAPELDDAALREFGEIVKVMRPSVQQFASDWSGLAPPDEAREVWDKELRVNELRLKAIDELVTGLTRDDWDMVERGWDGMSAASPLGREADSMFYKIIENCGYLSAGSGNSGQ